MSLKLKSNNVDDNIYLDKIIIHIFYLIIYNVKYLSILILTLCLTFNTVISNDSTMLTSEVTETKDNVTEKGSNSNIMKNQFIPLSEFMYADNTRYTISGDLPLENTDVKLLPTLAFGTGLTTIFIAQHIAQRNTIWKNLVGFRIIEDIEQDFWVDKYGHFYGAYMASYIFSETLMECGLSYDAATVWGSALGLSYSTYVEILDGFGENWGFSPSDFYADVIGVTFFLGQHYIPFLQNFTPKFMYVPADWHGDKTRVPHETFIDDYSSQVFWLSVNVNNLLPVEAKNYWPDWIQISLGYTARNIVDVFHYPELKDNYQKITDVKKDWVWGSPRYILALDYDLTKILPDSYGFWNWFKQSLMYIKLPSPAIEFSNSKTRYYLVYPFRL